MRTFPGADQAAPGHVRKRQLRSSFSVRHLSYDKEASISCILFLGQTQHIVFQQVKAISHFADALIMRVLGKSVKRYQHGYLHGSYKTPLVKPLTNPTKTKPLTPKESKRLCLTNMLRSRSARTYAICRHLYGMRRPSRTNLGSIFGGLFAGMFGGIKQNSPET